jgi:two-component system, LytTR family, sensor kinase
VLFDVRFIKLTKGVYQFNYLKKSTTFQLFLRVVEKIIKNFYLRNIAALVIFISPDVLQSIAIHDKLGSMQIWAKVYSLSTFFVYFIFHNRVLYEHLLRKKKIFLYVPVFLLTLFFWRESTSYLFWLITKPKDAAGYQIRELKEFNAAFWLFIYWADIIYIYISLGVYLSFRYFNERARFLQIQHAQKELELKQLNEQLNPHFLFNALNNIYSHLLNESGHANELILKLSELMRYVLDSSKKNTVTLGEEMKFIDNYIAFEKERTGNRTDIEYDASIENPQFKVVPLIMFNFIENAFKHSSRSIHRSCVAIKICADDDVLRLQVSNTIPATNVLAAPGTGIDNTRRRLDILYHANYKLNISRSHDLFIVHLELKNMV